MVNKLVALLLRLLIGTIRLLPIPLFSPLSSCLVFLFMIFARKDLKNLYRNVHKILGLPRGSHFSKAFARQVFRHQVCMGLEDIRIIHQPDLLQVSGFGELKEMIARAEAAGRGHLICTGHVGSWELIGLQAVHASAKTFHPLAKPAPFKDITRFLNDMRNSTGMRVMWTDQPNLLRTMLRTLKAGESLGFVMDQKPGSRNGPIVRFFGHDVEFVTGPAMMATKTGCAVLGVYCLREGPFRYRLICEEILPSGHEESDLDSVTQKMASSIEGIIRLYPEQWTWNYRRWRFAD